jgi:electron transport complex protein RnfC
MMNTHDTPTAPNRAELTLTRHCPLVTCGQTVRRGERIATASAPGLGDLHTPMAGKVVHVDPYRIRIEAHGETAEVEPVELAGLSGAALLARLVELGADLPPARRLDTLIINGADSEPDIFARQHLLASSQTTLERGLETAVALYTPMRTVLAVLKGTSKTLLGTEMIEVSEQYPSALDPLVALRVTGRENPDDALVIGLETLFQLGRIIETGLPAMETVITVGRDTRLVSLGAPVGQILDEAGQAVADGDRIVLGGVLRGVAAASPSQGVARSTSAVSVVTNPAPVAQDAPCVGCGECVRHCPARLDPAMITSYAEFGMIDKAQAEHVDACFECGLCGFFCIARRPMLQYIRLAKNELARAKAQTGEVA